MKMSTITEPRNHPALVWLVSGVVLLFLSILGLFNQNVPGIEQLVQLLQAIQGEYILLAAFIVIFIEGLYVIGSFFPGSSIVLILAVLSQAGGFWFFALTILTIFIGWVLAGVVNLLFARQLRTIQAPEYEVEDKPLLTWMPTFRANYEVMQITEGGGFWRIFFSSVRVKFLASIATALFLYVVMLFISLEEVRNEEGFITVFVVAIISLVVGVLKLRSQK